MELNPTKAPIVALGFAKNMWYLHFLQGSTNGVPLNVLQILSLYVYGGIRT
jgi:hypothetical protein